MGTWNCDPKRAHFYEEFGEDDREAQGVDRFVDRVAKVNILEENKMIQTVKTVLVHARYV